MKLLDKILGKSIPKKPEDFYSVTIDEELIKVEHPRRMTEQILWKDIKEIRLINTDQGPVFPDICLALIGDNSGCLIPFGTKGYEKVYDVVSEYDNFNFENVIKSMACADNAQFILWIRE